MGCCASAEFHDQERGVPNAGLRPICFGVQDPDQLAAAETDNDQKGRVAVDHIFRPTREVYGQPADDMKMQKIDWSTYGIKLENRPSPSDFPAFANDKSRFTNVDALIPL
ncbi:hypothetical protein QR680_005254 [Steinernema hermaphroditum]|uniref:Uncharacterized protein n=1 Tax=Steinernema hermaphroditum TaxID=289476 RepID=A0AA39HSR4_9BILA|nr:hypothetical protein QR680_005254 [Steinernema hermaphroditum]